MVSKFLHFTCAKRYKSTASQQGRCDLYLEHLKGNLLFDITSMLELVISQLQCGSVAQREIGRPRFNNNTTYH